MTAGSKKSSKKGNAAATSNTHDTAKIYKSSTSSSQAIPTGSRAGNALKRSPQDTVAASACQAHNSQIDQPKEDIKTLLLGLKVQDAKFDDLRAAGDVDFLDMDDLYLLAVKYAVMSPNAKLPKSMAKIRTQLTNMQCQIFLSAPCIGAPCVYTAEPVIKAGLREYAKALGITVPDHVVPANAKWHWIRNEVTQEMLRDPVENGVLNQEVLEQFRKGGLAQVRAMQNPQEGSRDYAEQQQAPQQETGPQASVSFRPDTGTGSLRGNATCGNTARPQVQIPVQAIHAVSISRHPAAANNNRSAASSVTPPSQAVSVTQPQFRHSTDVQPSEDQQSVTNHPVVTFGSLRIRADQQPNLPSVPSSDIAASISTLLPAQSAVPTVAVPSSTTAAATPPKQDLLSTFNLFLDADLANKCTETFFHQGITAAVVNRDFEAYLKSGECDWGSLKTFERFQVKSKLGNWLQGQEAKRAAKMEHWVL